TPFRKGRVDEQALGDLIEFHISKGTNGIVPCGTTGESATLSQEEHEQVVAFTVEAVNHRVPVIAGTGSNSTEEAIVFTKHAKQVGSDAALLITPYYNKPTQEGLFQHFSIIAKTVDLPLILYNIPGRTCVNMMPTTVARLAKISSIIGIKEGSGSLQQVSDIIQECGDRVTVLSGDDPLTLPMMAIGAKGVITVTANIVPADMAAMVQAALEGHMDRAKALHYKMAPLFTALFYETNPIPVKEALAMMNKIDGELRLPMSPMAPDNRERLRQVMKDYGLL
ncbi:MAG: 4-hydroxy-tetrahydrodipicolinate synthase, partial [Nitrospirales bacterium]